MDFKAVLGVMRQAGFAGPLCLEKVILVNPTGPGSWVTITRTGDGSPWAALQSDPTAWKLLWPEVNANFVRARQYLQRLVEDTRPAASSSSL